VNNIYQLRTTEARTGVREYARSLVAAGAVWGRTVTGSGLVAMTGRRGVQAVIGGRQNRA